MPAARDRPRQVLLFSGHMIDAPDRPTPRFPPAMAGRARKAIAQRLDAVDAGRSDLAVCSAACGGDLLFAEEALARGVALEVYLPFDMRTFARRSVDFAGGDWPARYQAVLAASALHLMPAERPPLRPDQDPFEAVNQWMLDAASRFGSDRLVFIALWNGRDGDGPGGIAHLMDLARSRRVPVDRIDTTHLWG